MVDGSLEFEDGGTDVKTVIDSAFELMDEYPELENAAGDGELHMLVMGRADVSHADIRVPFSFRSAAGTTHISDSETTEMQLILDSNSLTHIERSVFDSFEAMFVRTGSRVEIRDSDFTGGSVNDTLFYIFGGSKISFEGSSIIPLFSNFALVLDGSQLTATSTQISDMEAYGIQASRGSKIWLFDVSMDTILSPTTVSAFLSLLGSDATVVNSTFRNAPATAIELYKTGTTFSKFSLTNSVVEDFVDDGISATQATVSVKDSIIRGGTNGIDNIFSSTTVSNSHISGNSGYGIRAQIATFIVDARNNFWGDASGPLHPTENPEGKGSQVSDNVLFEPWLLEDPKKVCCSSVLFLPGFQASRLYEMEEEKEIRLWEPTLDSSHIFRLFMNEQGESLRQGIYTRDIISEALVPIAGPNIYKSFISFMDALKENGTIRNWKSIPYDWRLPLDVIIESENISEKLLDLARSSKTGKVTLIAHSNGGLLAKELMRKLSETGIEHLVDAAIFAAVPQIGTPQAVGALLHGYGQGIPFLLSVENALKLGRNMPSAYNLLPSIPYFDSVSDPVIKLRESGLSIASSTPLRNFLSAKNLNSFLIGIAQEVHQNLDAWIPPPSMRFIQIAGWGIDTVSGIEYYMGKKKGIPILEHKPIMVIDGDSTVVVPSALYVSTSTPSIERYWLDLRSYNSYAEKILHGRVLNRTHADMFEVNELRDFIGSVLRKENSLPNYFSTSTPVVKGGGGGGRLHFILNSSAQIHAYDDVGNHTGISTSSAISLIEEQIPETYYREFGEIKYISTPGSGGIRLIVKDFETSTEQNHFSLHIEQADPSGRITDSVSFVDIPLEPHASMEVMVPNVISSIADLQISNPSEMQIEQTQSQIVVIDPVVQNGQHRKTTIRDIDELIATIELPKSVKETFGSSTPGSRRRLVDEPVIQIMPDQTASVFQSGMTLREALSSILALIIAILKKMFLWFLTLFV